MQKFFFTFFAFYVNTDGERNSAYVGKGLFFLKELKEIIHLYLLKSF